MMNNWDISGLMDMSLTRAQNGKSQFA